MAFPTGWTRLAVIDDFQVVGGPHTNFPVLLNEDLLSVALGIADNGGGDLRYSSDAAGSSQLACDCVDFDTSGSTAEVHVTVPSLSNASEIHVWAKPGDSETQPAVGAAFGRNATWPDDEAVFHMGDASGGAVDSTGNGNDATSETATLSYGEVGQVGGAIGFAGGALNTPSDDALQTTGDLTLSCWAWWPAVPPSNQFEIISRRQPNSDRNYSWRNRQGKANLLGAGSHSASSTLPTEQWVHMAVTRTSGGAVTHYLNGSADGTGSVTLNTITGHPTALGNDSEFESGEFFLDEPRVHFGIRSADWIATEFANQSDPASFATATAVAASNVLTPQTGSVMFTGYQPTLVQTHVLTPETGSLRWTGYRPNLVHEGTGAVTVRGQHHGFQFAFGRMGRL